MECDDLETIVKVIVVGNGGVGKSSLTARYCKGTFTSTYKKTIGVDFLEKTLDSGLTTGESVKLMIWDTAGQEEFDSITASYYRGAGACAIVFSSTDRASFEAIERWKKKVEAEFEGKMYPILCLVQNKADLIDTEGGSSGSNGSVAQMSAIEVEAIAKRLNMRLFRTSVKLDQNVKDVFEYLATEYILRSQDPPMVIKQSEEKNNGTTKSGTLNSISNSNSTSSNLNNSSNTISLSSNVSTSTAAATTTTMSSSVNGAASSTPSTNAAGGGGGGGGGLANALLPPDVLARVNESSGLPAPAGTIRLGSSSEKTVKKKKTGLFGGC